MLRGQLAEDWAEINTQEYLDLLTWRIPFCGDGPHTVMMDKWVSMYESIIRRHPVIITKLTSWIGSLSI